MNDTLRKDSAKKDSKTCTFPEDIGTGIILWIVALVANTINSIVVIPTEEQLRHIILDMHIKYPPGKLNQTISIMYVSYGLALLVLVGITAVAIWRYSRASKIALTVLNLGAFLTIFNALSIFNSDVSAISAILVIIAAVADAGALVVSRSKAAKKFFGLIVEVDR